MLVLDRTEGEGGGEGREGEGERGRGERGRGERGRERGGGERGGGERGGGGRRGEGGGVPPQVGYFSLFGLRHFFSLGSDSRWWWHPRVI